MGTASGLERDARVPRVYGARAFGSGAGAEPIACLVSLVAHAAVAAALIAAWIRPWELEEAKRGERPPPPPPMTWIESAPGSDVPVADVSERALPEEVAQPVLAASDPEPKPEPNPAPKPEPNPAPEPDLANVLRVAKAPVLDEVTAELPPGGAATGDTAEPGPPSPRPAPRDATLGQEKAPDLAARFTKELPRYAADVEAWKTLKTGASAEVTFTLELDETGKVVRKEPPAAPPTELEAALAASLQRTARSLVTKLALPDRPVGAGTLEIGVIATIADGPEREAGDDLELSFSYDGKLKKGSGTFVLRTGRAVTFDVRVVSVDAAQMAASGAAREEAASGEAEGAPPHAQDAP